MLSAVTFWMIRKAPTGFIPTEDQGFIVILLNLPPGASLDRTQKVMDKVDSLLSQVEAVEKTCAISRFKFYCQCQQLSNYGVGFIRMKPPGERGAVKNVEGVMGSNQPEIKCNKRSQCFSFSVSHRTGIWKYQWF